MMIVLMSNQYKANYKMKGLCQFSQSFLLEASDKEQEVICASVSLPFGLLL